MKLSAKDRALRAEIDALRAEVAALRAELSASRYWGAPVVVPFVQTYPAPRPNLNTEPPWTITCSGVP